MDTSSSSSSRSSSVRSSPAAVPTSTTSSGPEDVGSNPNPSSLVAPLSIILVKNSSRGDRLLFRYPYKAPYHLRQQTTVSTVTTPTITSTRRRLYSPIVEESLLIRRRRDVLFHNLRRDSGDSSATATILEEEDENGGNINNVQSPLSREGRSGSLSARPFQRKVPLRTSASNSSAGLLFSHIRSPSAQDTHPAEDSSSDVFVTKEEEEAKKKEMTKKDRKYSPADGAKMLGELSDRDLSNLLSVSSDLSERKFELKLNYIRFVGHPTLVQGKRSVRRREEKSGSGSSVKLFHIVFCLNAVASHSIVKCFHDLSKRLGLALRHEEDRCGYLTEEFKSMIALHDEVYTSETPEDTQKEFDVKQKLFDGILGRSKLARLLKQVYNEVVDKGRTFIRVNGWIQISFCLPQKIHVLKFRDNGASLPLVEPEAIHRCLEAIRPYHAILLLVEAEELSESLVLDTSASLSRLLVVYSPLKSLQTLAADADLTLSHVMEIASHLVYWALASVVYPLCESNVYVLSPDADPTGEALRKEWGVKFPGVSLARTMADFAMPMPLGERINLFLGGNWVQAQTLAVVTWLLRYRLIIHLHTYVYLTSYFDGGSSGPLLVTLEGALNSMVPTGVPFIEDEDEASDSFSDEVSLKNSNGKRASIPSEALPQTPNTNTTASPGEEGVEGTTTTTKRDLAEDIINLPEINQAVRRAVSSVKTSLSSQDIKLFARLSKYFIGDFHLEEIMYRENVVRSQIMLLLDKFRDVLVTVEKEDAEINFFKLF